MKKLDVKKAYTLAEIVTAMVVLGIVISITLKITASKIERVNKYNYYAAYNILTDLSAELITESENGLIPDSGLCSIFEERLNLLNGDIEVDGEEKTPSCAVTHSISSSTKDFSKLVPNLAVRSGVKFYNLNASAASVSQLAGAEENDAEAYTIYIDIDGQRSLTALYNDVYPFYLTKSGKVIPAYPTASNAVPAGGNATDSMLFSVRYEEIVSEAGVDKRIEHWLLKSVSFKEAACKSGYIKSNTYCSGYSIDANCSSETSDCILVPLKPIKYMVK